MKRVTFTLCALVCSSFGCASSRSAEQASPGASAVESASPEASAAAAASPASLPSPSSLPTTISEEAFIALHEHSDQKPPALSGEEVTVAGLRMYLSLPKGRQGPVPAVLIIHEWWGLNDHIRHWADRIAAEGYAALAVDLYRGGVATEREDAMKLMRSVDDSEALVTLGAALAFVREDPRIQAPKVATIGWCFGGGWSLRASLAHSVDATVIYYGRLVTDADVLRPMKGEVLGVFGNLDRGIPPAQVDAFEAALQGAGVAHRILRFDANHAFANPSSARYHRVSAEAAWGQVRTFLRTQLTGQAS